jgi:uncharacterized membrane protein YdbT with pleckstrin-like domain
MGEVIKTDHFGFCVPINSRVVRSARPANRGSRIEVAMEEQTLEGKYQAEIERLDAEHREYEKLWTQVPRFAWVVLLAPVIGFIWGFGWFVAAVLVSGALVGTRAYLIAVRRTENRWNRDKLVEDLRESLQSGRTLTA